MTRIRTFLAIEATESIRGAGESLIRKLTDFVEGGRWVKRENIHLSLKFLGDVEDHELHSVCRAARAATAKAKPFVLDCQSMGVFPNMQKPNTIWMGVNDANNKLADLQQHVEDALSDLGFPLEIRRFTGHLTLGRIRSSRGEHTELQEFVDSQAEKVYGQMSVTELVVFSSELNREGPTYNVIGRCPLGAIRNA